MDWKIGVIGSIKKKSWRKIEEQKFKLKTK